ncbi:MAG: hypothetical protein KC621_15175 [Myxococcales bacterium]|nr:hypothetical protein [Myxococcales bacterium]
MRIRTIVALSLAWGCQVEEADPDDGGQSGTAIPDGCYEDHRETVTDPTVPSEGFDRSADDAIGELAGTWTASGTVSGEAATVTLEVAHDGGPIEAVYLEYHESEGGGEAMGAPTGTPTDCPPRYAFGVITSLDLAPWVSGEGAGDTHADMVGNTWFTAETPLDEVVGTAAPSFDTADWDRTELAATLTHAEDDVRLDLSWWGINDQQTPPPAATGTGTVTTATVEPSGVTEPIASFSGLTKD